MLSGKRQPSANTSFLYSESSMKTGDTLRPEQLVSATDSVQSSIVLPKFSYKDILYASGYIYGEELGSLQNIHPATMLNLPVSNRLLIKNSGIVYGYIFAVYRQLLSVFFLAYEWYLRGTTFGAELLGFLSSFFWFIITLLPLVCENVSMVETKTEATITPVESSKGHTIRNLYSDLRNIRTLVGNYALSKSLKQVTHPRSRMIVRKSLGNFVAPHHCAFVLEMNVLAVKQPPEIPVPFLDGEKKLVIPEKEKVAKAMTLRAEWATAHHTHKAAETVRIVYESAKIIAWSACSNIRIITIYERNGYGWENIYQLANLVQEEMRNLTKAKYNVKDHIKIIDLDSGENIDALDHSSKVCLDNTTIKSVSPSPQTAISSFDGETVLHQLNTNTFSTHLTVFLLSGKHVTHRSGIKECIGSHLLRNFGAAIESGYLYSPSSYVSHYQDPQLILKYAGARQQRESLDGFPLAGNSPIVIKYSVQPVSFSAFWEGLQSFSKQIRQTSN